MRPRDEQLRDIENLPEGISPFDEGGIQSCVEHVDDSQRGTIAEALMSPATIKAMLQRVFVAGQKLNAALKKTGQQLVTIVQNAVSQVVATVQSLIDSIFAIFRAV
jgi:hypothetical protein